MKQLSKGVYFFALFMFLNIGLVTFALAQEALPGARPVSMEETVGSTQSLSKLQTEISETTASITGMVLSDGEPVADARVRIQATTNMVSSDADGAFTLPNVSASEIVTVTAWSEGHYNGWTAVAPGEKSVVITLTRHHQSDNFAYEWFEKDGIEGSRACGTCHPSFKEWQADGHSQSATDYRFLTMYVGTDVDGNQTNLKKTNLGIPLAPEPDDDDYHGPGFKLDSPNNPGQVRHLPYTYGRQRISNMQTCGWSGCHKDGTAAYAGPNVLDPGVSPTNLHGDAAEGISCDFCHKVSDVLIEKESGLPYSDRPGILSYTLKRPSEGQDIFFGSLDDVSQPKDTYAPVFEESAFCAGCHYGIMGDVVVGDMQTTGGVLIYSSYLEWLESPYSDEETGKTCQDCHMPADGDTPYFVYPSAGGVIRDPSQIHNHEMLPDSMLQESVTLTSTAVITNGQLLVNVEIFNDKTGHHVPTDAAMRHMILVIEAIDDDGKVLRQIDGPELPDWTGDYEGQPGRGYARLLRDMWSGEMPTGAIWRPVEVEEDTRIAALDVDRSNYAFRAPTSGIADVHIRLIYRKAFQDVMESKDWNDPDIIMEETTLQVEER